VAEASWRREEAGALVLLVHVQPGAKRSSVAGIHGEGKEARVKLRVAAPASEGRANGELTRFLAEQFGVARRAVAILHGESSRHKTVRIAEPLLRPDRDWDASG
jgi:uncharacterized protein